METFLSEKHRTIQRSVRTFCQREIQPIAKEIDQEATFPWEVVEKMGKLGYFGIQVPQTLGGAGLDTVGYIIVVEEISKACAGLGLCVTVHNSVAVYPLLAFGSDEQIQKWVPPLAKGEKIGAFCLTEPNVGSDAAGIEASAIRADSHYLVNANKVFVTNGGVADVCLIFTRTDANAGSKGISVIIVERVTCVAMTIAIRICLIPIRRERAIVVTVDYSVFVIVIVCRISNTVMIVVKLIQVVYPPIYVHIHLSPQSSRRFFRC